MAVRKIRKETYDYGYELDIELDAMIEHRKTHHQYLVKTAHDGYIGVIDLRDNHRSYINNDDLTRDNYFNVTTPDGDML